MTEFCSGGDLDTLLHEKRHVFLSLPFRMQLGREIAEGLAWLHGTGYIHRDLKPANIFLDANQRVKIGDFGFALREESKRVNFKGSALWMAPEKLAKKEETKRSDVYSFGVILWELLTREDPFVEYEDINVFTDAVCQGNERPSIPEGVCFVLGAWCFYG